MLRLMSCAVIKAEKENMKCGNRFSRTLFIGIFWRTQINKLFFSYRTIIIFLGL